MQSQQCFPSQAAATAPECVVVSTQLPGTQTIVVFVTYAVANISALYVQEASCLLSSYTHELMCSLDSIIMKRLTSTKKKAQQNCAPVRRRNYV